MSFLGPYRSGPEVLKTAQNATVVAFVPSVQRYFVLVSCKWFNRYVDIYSGNIHDCTIEEKNAESKASVMFWSSSNEAHAQLKHFSLGMRVIDVVQI